MNQWRNLFANQLDQSQDQIEQLVLELQELDEEIEMIRPMLPVLKEKVIPIEKSWLAEIKQLKTPFNVRPLLVERFKLFVRYFGATWFRWPGFSGRMYLLRLRFAILLNQLWRIRIFLLVLAGGIALSYLIPLIIGG